MINFTFGVLGSVLFWGAYITLSLFMTVILLRVLDKNTLDFLLNKSSLPKEDVPYFMVAILIYLLFWPIIISALSIWLLIKGAFWLVEKSLVAINDIVPTISFKKNEPKQPENENVEKLKEKRN